MGRLKKTLAVAVGAGEGAFHIAEELGFHQVLGNRAAVDGHERPRRARRQRMDGARRTLLAAARLAADHHRGHAARQPQQRAAHLLHGGGMAGQQRIGALGEIGAAGIGIALLATQCVEHQAAQLIERQRLGDIVERPRLERLHRVLGAAVGGDDGHRRAVGGGRKLAHQIDAQAVAQAHVGQHQRKALPRQRLARLAQAGGQYHVVPHAPQGDLQQLAQVGLVIDDENGFANDGGFGHGRLEERLADHSAGTAGWSNIRVMTKARRGRASRASMVNAPVRSSKDSSAMSP